MTVEMAMNRAQTSHSYNGVNAGTFPDGKEHPGLGYTDDGKKAHDSCISNPNRTYLNYLARSSTYRLTFSSFLFGIPLTFPHVKTRNETVHTQNETRAAGSAFAISYTSDLKKVTNENLVVFSVKDK